MTVDPEKKTIVVSPRIHEEYENGREYYALHGPVASATSKHVGLCPLLKTSGITQSTSSVLDLIHR
jgi:hypothetical protein